jgi:sugar phosphate isomerase/epimerase
MPSGRLVSLAAGTVLDLDPVGTVDAAAAAGFGATGLWFDPATWTPATTAAVARRLAATGITPLDIEPVILGRGDDPGDAMVDTAAELGVGHVLVASGPADRAAVVQRFGELCERAAPGGVVVVLEFLPIFSVGTLAEAVAVVTEADQGNGAVLVDTLHLARSGGTPDELEAVPSHLLPYLQIADAPTEPPAPGREALRDEALHGRLLPGEGALPLRAALAAVPDVPLSIELRSAALMAAFPDPTDRARAVRAACARLLAAT